MTDHTWCTRIVRRHSVGSQRCIPRQSEQAVPLLRQHTEAVLRDLLRLDDSELRRLQDAEVLA